MGSQHRYAGAVVVAGVAALAVAGLGGCSPTRNSFQDDATVSDRITAVQLDTDAGNVTVEGRPGATQVSVHRSVEYAHGRPDGTTRVENGTLVLGGCGDDCSVSYTVEAPAGLPIGGRTSAGEIRLSRVGEVAVHTNAGGITLDDVGGPVDVHTSSGSIVGTALRGERIQARTSNGDIRLTPATAQDITARTSNGAITVTVPAAAYHVSTSTSHGSIRVGVGDDPGGRYRLDLTTSNGDITAATG
ncbi:DUF4097 family beta strand repeat-containing protein [Kitasatospora sp. NPDC048722]|uniref:DUF4097 family beta strand repeat-containing protein n=1 Tax=Kitasatospora sp. NPDC048722 TaxID=3155639 RepID=UPI003407FBDF